MAKILTILYKLDQSSIYTAIILFLQQAPSTPTSDRLHGKTFYTQILTFREISKSFPYKKFRMSPSLKKE